MKELQTAVRAHAREVEVCATRARSIRRVLCALLLLAGCQTRVADDQVVQAPALPMPEPDAGPLDMREPPCAPAVTAEPVPARAATMGDDKLGTDEGVHVSQLFNMFKTNCGDCHVTPASLGQFSLTLGDFLNAQDEFLAGKINKTIQLIRADNPDRVMPKNGPLLKDRPADHPLRTFADLLEQWLREGRPITFYPTGGMKSASASGGHYRLRKEVGTQLTNVGNCVPMGQGQALAMKPPEMDIALGLDEKFAAMRSFTDLPKSLHETDLSTLDFAELMKLRIFGYAPAYTLWADNAKKIRAVRVPVGESIKFDKDTQSFVIPENTRFYKTFLKKVKDLEGREGYRKVETRLIVTRRASVGPDGKSTQNAVFGTYQWNDDESEATLVDTPYRDDEGFQDRVLQLVIDEQRDDEILRTKPKDALAARLAGTALPASAAAPLPSMRTYAIPGFDRCVQCHMGAPGQDFALGFTPLQILRRPMGEGGVFEPAGRDELNQLQRLINYGLVTGISAPDEVVGLEESQGSREPRNDHELTAQGYMLGNCAHCHNPNGFPSQKEQVMKEDLNFMPSETGGIFQFPLTRKSRRTFRGAAQDIQIPYITPSLYDFTPTQLQHGVQELEPQSGEVLDIAPAKWIANKLRSESYGYTFDEVEAFKAVRWTDTTVQLAKASGDVNTFGFGGWFSAVIGSARPLLAPWRSLIYRNVDAPFSYQEAGTVFPHMPMHTAGYDCRARQLLGKWMTSIPARWKNEGKASPYKWPSSTVKDTFASQSMTAGKPFDEGLQDVEEQPYEEVAPDDASYLTAALAAQARLSQFVGSERFKDCPDSTEDILDPVVASTGNVLPAGLKVELKDAKGKSTGEQYEVLAPARTHYFQTDLRLSKRWVLRRGDWYQSLVDGNDVYALGADQAKAFKALREVLLQIKVDDAWRSFATGKVPFGLWDEANPSKEMCQVEFDRRKIPTVAQLASAQRPEWMKYVPATQASSAQYAPDARVFMTSPGEHVFDLICSKCHGSKGDGDSALASTMADLTGGLTRVANLRDGIFGPVLDPGANRKIPKLGFGVVPDAEERENWAARYVAWMGLGGTRAYIPEAAVGSLRRFTILGQLSALQSKFESFNKADAGNMLKVAKDQCGVLIARNADTFVPFDVASGLLSKEVVEGRKIANAELEDTPFHTIEQAGLIAKNGHAELWENLCTYQNPYPVRVVRYYGKGAGRDLFAIIGLYARSAYPPDAPIGSGAGKVAETLRSDNLTPWCLERPYSERLRSALEGKELPYCPEQVANREDPNHQAFAFDDYERWTLRGAANAGVAVFLFFDDLNRKIASGQVSPRNVAYDRCQDFVGMRSIGSGVNP